MAEFVNTPFERNHLLIQESGMDKLQAASVLILGIGGVGSYVAESLARSGVGTLILVDGDRIAMSNCNRQIHANLETIGLSKTMQMKERIHSYAPNCNVVTYDMFYNEESNEQIFQNKIDFVVDAIDTMSCKLAIIQYCKEHNIPFISSMGMANRLDPTKIEITDLSKTNYDPVAKIMRNLVKKHRIRGKIPVAFSSEQPIVQTQIINEDGQTRKQKMPPASMIFVPAAAGLAIGSYVVRELIK
jgi:tRNA A37 threonylcarbamoyladenosine dehydratase